jgi:hypothetical protein
MVIIISTSILGGQKEDKGMMCSITPNLLIQLFSPKMYLESTTSEYLGSGIIFGFRVRE